MQEKHYLVPQHEEGTATDIVHNMPAETTEDAEDLFVDAKDRLLDVGNWARYAGLEDVHFRLADGHGHIVSRHARRADHILINNAGEAPSADYDWFTINALEYDDYPDTNVETFAIRLSPSANPRSSSNGIAATARDTSTIVVERRGVLLSAIYHARNNTDENDGTWHGLQETQWQSLMKGLLEYYG